MTDDIQTERVIANEILKNNHIYTLIMTEEFCIYSNGKFSRGQDVYTKIKSKIDIIAKDMMVPVGKTEKPYNYNISNRNIILEMIRAKTYIPFTEFDKEPNYICCKNGIYNFGGFDDCILPNPASWEGDYNAKRGDQLILGTKNFLTYEEYIRKYKEPYKNFIQIPVDYDPEAICPNIEKFLEDVFGIDAVELIYEMLAYILMPHIKYQKAFMIYGEPSTGKTTFLDMIYIFFNGEYYFSKQSLQNLGKQFQAVNLRGKLGNLFDDLTENYIGDSSMFRQIVTNRYIQSEKKYAPEEVKWNNRTKLIFATNILAKVNKNEGDQFYRRWILLCCYTIFKDKELINEDDQNGKPVKVKDYHMWDKITTKEEFSGFLNKIIEGWIRLEERGNFPPEWNNIEYIKGLWLLDVNPVKLFVDECCTIGKDEQVDYNTFYHTLNRFRKDHNAKEISKHMCTQWLQRMDGIEKKKRGNGSFYYGGISIKDNIDTSYNRLFIESEKVKKIDDF